MTRSLFDVAWIASLCLAAVCAMSVPVLAEPNAVDTQPPTKEAFAAEVQAIEDRVGELEAKSDLLEASYNAAREKYREQLDAQRELRSAFNKESETYREAWDEVRQILIEGVAGDALTKALKSAHDAEAVYLPKREAHEQAIAKLDADIKQTRADQDEFYKSYRAANDQARGAASLLRAAQSAQRSQGREGWHADYLKQRQMIEADLVQKQKQAEQEAERKAEFEREDAEWDARYDEMTPEEQATALRRLTTRVELLQAQSDALGKQVDALSELRRSISDQRSEATRKYSSTIGLVSALSRQIRELERQADDDPESKAKLEAVRADYEAALKQQQASRALTNELQQQLVKISDEWSAARKEYQAVREEHFALTQRHRQASRKNPGDGEANQLDKKAKVIRETWQLISGQDVQWGDNPFQGQPVRTIGNITNQGPNLRLYYDSADHHAMYSMIGNERRLHLFDSAGKVLFDGPASQPDDLKDASQEVFYLWEYLANRVTYNGR